MPDNASLGQKPIYSFFEDVSDALVTATNELYGSDRRFDTRYKFHGAQISLSPFDTNEVVWSEAKPLDLSRGGTLVTSRHKYQEGDRLWLTIRPDKAATHVKPFMIAGIVKHCIRVGESYRVGIQFKVDLMNDLRRNHALNSVSQLEAFLQSVNRPQLCESATDGGE